MFDKVRHIEKLLKNAGATRVLMVGGCVRDRLMGVESKDIDVEVYGLPYQEIVNALSGIKLDLVGESFAVVKLTDLGIDVSIPRRDNKSGVGHRGFDIAIDPSMTPKEAASRRDFTINSLAMDSNGNIYDFFNGMYDIEKKILRATSDAFEEDPLRVLRGMQFAGRFGMTMDHDTIQMCQDISDEFDAIPKERVWEEWNKWAVKSLYPSMGLDVLFLTWWASYFKEIWNLNSLPQDSTWHPEGDVLTHTKLVCDQIPRLTTDCNDYFKSVLMFAALCHDMGKVVTTKVNEEGRIVSPEHDKMGVPIAEEFLKSIGSPIDLIDKVKPLVAEHMVHINGEPTPRAVRRLSNRLAPHSSINLLSIIIEADHSGRPPLPKGNPFLPWLEVAKEVKVEDGKPEPILMGRHLIEMGMKPGKEFGTILEKVYQLQLDGVVTNLEEAKAEVSNVIN